LKDTGQRTATWLRSGEKKKVEREQNQEEGVKEDLQGYMN